MTPVQLWRLWRKYRRQKRIVDLMLQRVRLLARIDAMQPLFYPGAEVYSFMIDRMVETKEQLAVVNARIAVLKAEQEKA